ncbi:MAG: MerR family transcriptional regulator [uncultured bacterium]|nr:MAG: MerR family transcriptional regulator [uncultured bacterium]
MQSPIIPDKLYFKIGEVSDLVGVKAYVLRYWESEFKEIAPVKSQTNQRLYRRKDVEMLLRVRHLLYRERYTISGAKKVLKQEFSSVSPVAAEAKDEIKQLDFVLEEKNKINIDTKLEAVDTLKKILREMQESLKQLN